MGNREELVTSGKLLTIAGAILTILFSYILNNMREWNIRQDAQIAAFAPVVEQVRQAQEELNKNQQQLSKFQTVLTVSNDRTNAVLTTLSVEVAKLRTEMKYVNYQWRPNNDSRSSSVYREPEPKSTAK